MLGAQDIKSYIDPRSLLIGFGVVVLLYVCLFSYALVRGPSLLKDLQSRLAQRSFTVVNEEARDTPLVHEAKPLNYEDKPDALPSLEKDAHRAHDLKKTEAHHVSSKKETSKNVGAADLIPGLYKKSKTGYLPVIRKRDGLTPFEGYRRSFVADPAKVQLALAFKDIGLSNRVSMKAMENLPEYVSMIVSPYARDIEQWQRASSAYGHELWLSVPAEDNNYPLSEPGSQGILTRAGFDENQKRFLWALSRTHGYAGIAMYTDDAFSVARNTIQGLVESAFKRGLGFLEMNSYGSNGLDRIAKDLEAPYIANNLGGDVVFDEISTALERQAKDSGFVVAVLSPTPANIDAVVEWSKGLEAKGIQLAPVSAAFTRYIRVIPKGNLEDDVEQETEQEDHH